jgi:hypothetical protein
MTGSSTPADLLGLGCVVTAVPIAAFAVDAIVALAASGWYARTRWLR